MRTKTLLPLLGILSLTAASAFAQYGRGAVLTYVAGQAAVNGLPANSRSANSTTVDLGQMLSTGMGSAELALTPGAMLRMDQASSVKLISLDDKHTEVAINSGRAEIDLAGMRQGSELQVDTPSGVQTLLIQNGLYEFDAKAGELRVFDGKAAVSNAGSNDWIDVKAGHELALNGSAGKPAEFDRNVSDGFASRNDAESTRGGGYGYGGPAYGFAGGGYGDYGYGGYGYAPYGYGYGLYDPFAFGFYPGFYGGYGFYGGFGYGGFGGYRGGFGGRGFGGRR